MCNITLIFVYFLLDITLKIVYTIIRARENSTGKGGREYRKGKQEHQEERIRMREIGMHLEERYAAMPTAADAPPLKSN